MRRLLTLAIGLAATACLALTAQASAYVYWANNDTGTIGRANIDGTDVDHDFITGAAFPSALAVDEEHIYWTNAVTNSVGRANLDGTGVDQSFITGAGVPAGIAVDDEHIYWTNSTGPPANTIARADLDGTDVNQSFITGAAFPSGLAVDDQHIFWANNDNDQIARADLDGTDVDQAFITAAADPGGVAIAGQHLYWTNLLPNSIGRANLDGSSPNQSFIPGAPVTDPASPVGLAVVGGHIYWANSVDDGSIGRANIDGTGVDQSFITGASEPTAVAVDAHTLTASTIGPGKVESSPAGIDCGTSCEHPFAAETTVTLTATPEAGAVFTGWTGGGCSGSAPTCEVSIDADKTVTASFAPASPLTITKTGTGTGTVTSSPAGIDCGTSCEHDFATGTKVTLIATPAPGSTFARWSGAGCPADAPTCAVTLDAGTAVTASFAARRTLTIASSGSGTGTVTSSPAGINCGTLCSHQFDHGTVVELTATPSADSTFAGWSGGGCSSASSCTVTMTADVQVSASFAAVPPSNQFRFAGVKRNRKRGTAKLMIQVQAPGTLRLAKSKRVRRASRSASEAGRLSILVRPTKRMTKLLKKRRRARTTAKITFVPTGGEPRTKRKRLALVRRR